MIFIAVLAAVSCVALCEPGYNVNPPRSYHMSDAQKAKGMGRKNMAKLMYLKKMASLDRQKCFSSGDCPPPPKSVTGAITTCDNGFAGEYPCDKVDMLAFINFEDLGYSGNVEGNDIWVWHDEDNNDYYALMGITAGTSFVRVTDPVNPVVVGILRTETSSSTWRDMKVIGNFAFIVSEASEHGMQVFDLTQLRGLDSDPENEFKNYVLYSGVSNTHNIVANPASQTVFLVGSTRGDAGRGLCSGGLHMVDVSDPTNATLSGCFGIDGYVHDAECIIYDGPDTRYTDKEICFGYNEDSLTIYDVTDKSSEGDVIARVSYEGVQYSHQGWATEDRKYLLLDDELDEAYGSDKRTKTFVWDIQDLENPVLVNTFIAAHESIDHNMYILGNYVHQTNYESGYRILNLNNLPNLTEVAYFDVFPSRTTAQFYGSWSNYPWMYDTSGNQFTVVSSIDFGLFVLKPRWDEIQNA